MKRLTDQQFDRRVTEINKQLEQTANRHANLLDHLRPDFPRRWTCTEMGEHGGDSIEVRARINTMVRPPLSLDDS